jgi:hypothetical protein
MEITKELVFIAVCVIALMIVLFVPNFRIKIFGFFSAQGKESKKGNVTVKEIEGQVRIEVTEKNDTTNYYIEKVKGDFAKGKPTIKINPDKKN